MSRCPEVEAWQRYLIGAVTEAEVESLGGHLRTCAACLARLDRLGQPTDAMMAALRADAGAGLPFAGEPALQRAVASVLDAARRVGPGVVLGEYRLIEKIGEGGMGAVWRAMHLRLEKEVALKVLAAGRVHDAEAVARFRREMRAVGRVSHPHIVAATDAGEDGVPYLVMEYVPGTDLARLVRSRGPLAVADACELVRQAALGLQHAHDNGLVHRDVKPSNLLLTPDGRVMVLDLGLALFLGDATAEVAAVADDAPTGDCEGSPTLTTPGRVLGTRDYMAPEQRRDPGRVDARADVYGLGCTLWFLLTGFPPGPTSPRPDLPAGLDKILGRMLADLADRRPTRIGRVAERLAPFAAGSRPAALYRGEPTPAPKSRRSSLIVAVTTAIVVALAVAVSMTWREAKRAEPVTCSHRPTPGRLPMTADEADALRRAWAADLDVPAERVGSQGLRMMLIPPGEFGLAPESRARLTKAYRLSATEVTVGQFRAFVRATGHRTAAEVAGYSNGLLDARPGHTRAERRDGLHWASPEAAGSDDLPVVHVGFDDARAYCAWLSRAEGRAYRLPTAAEWQWAARAGVHRRYPKGDVTHPMRGLAWATDTADGETHPVAGFAANAWGLHDMLGNVQEWTADRHGPFPPGVHDDPAGPRTGSYRVACGGSYLTASPSFDGRVGLAPKTTSTHTGFRVACEP